jgi:hypothetical protein
LILLGAKGKLPRSSDQRDQVVFERTVSDLIAVGTRLVLLLQFLCNMQDDFAVGFVYKKFNTFVLHFMIVYKSRRFCACGTWLALRVSIPSAFRGSPPRQRRIQRLACKCAQMTPVNSRACHTNYKAGAHIPASMHLRANKICYACSCS